MKKKQRKTAESPLVSVIVPVYNVEEHLEQALTSIESQTYRNLEIICVNDGSTDGSLLILEEHACRDPRIRVIDKKNGGYGSACNRGIDEANGEWISIVEPDDWIEPGMFGDMLAYASTLPETPDVVKTPYWRIWMPDSPQQRKLNCSYKNRIRPRRPLFPVEDAPHLLDHHPSIWSAIYRRDYLVNNNIRFHEIPGAGWADNPFLLETLCQTDRIAYLERAYYCYREETPEESHEFTKRNVLLPIERWNDMADVLDRLCVSDERILRAHYHRGFTYLGGILETIGLERPDIRSAAEQMFARMDAEIVFSDPEISPGSKQLFAELHGVPCPRINRFEYAIVLIRQALYSLRNTGLTYTLRATTTFLTKRKAREGGTTKEHID